MSKLLETTLLKQLKETHDDFSIQNINSLHGGYLSHVFQINSNLKPTVLWLNENKDSPKLSRQLIAIAILKKYFYSLIPDVYTSNRSSIGCYYIMSKLNGENLERTLPYLTTEEQIHFFKSMGHLLGNIHLIGSKEKVGYLDNLQRIPWKDWLGKYINSLIQDLLSQESHHNNSKWLTVQNALINHLEFIDEPNNFSFLHGDYYPGNILYTEDFISGLLDFEWSLYGDPLYDFRVMEVFIFREFPYHKEFYNSYQQVRKLPSDFYKTILFYAKVYQLELISMAYSCFSKDHYFIKNMEPDLINWASKNK